MKRKKKLKLFESKIMSCTFYLLSLYAKATCVRGLTTKGFCKTDSDQVYSEAGGTPLGGGGSPLFRREDARQRASKPGVPPDAAFKYLLFLRKTMATRQKA